MSVYDAEPDDRWQSFTLTTSSTSSSQVIGTFALAKNTASVLDAIVVGKVTGSGGGASVKLSGTFVCDNSGTVTRDGTDDIGTVKGDVAQGTSTFDLHINGQAVEIRVSPSSASSTLWKATAQAITAVKS
jgi:hypothetical protein